MFITHPSLNILAIYWWHIKAEMWGSKTDIVYISECSRLLSTTNFISQLKTNIVKNVYLFNQILSI